MNPDSEHLDEGALGELRMVLGSDFAVLVQTFLDDSALRLASMRSALAQANHEAVREAAHSFKGSSMNLGALRLAAFCRQLEDQARAGNAAALPGLIELLGTEFAVVAGLLQPSRQG